MEVCVNQFVIEKLLKILRSRRRIYGGMITFSRLIILFETN
jgi:hypothetical protein